MFISSSSKLVLYAKIRGRNDEEKLQFWNILSSAGVSLDENNGF
jgi:hypothetical protein